MTAIYVIAPGGRTATGGMCRMVDYFITEWETRGRRPPLVLLDSTGPHVGAGLYMKWQMPYYFFMAVLRIGIDGMRGRIALLHLHMAERGSVLRKGLLLWLARWLHIPIVLHMHGAEFVEFYQKLPSSGRRVVTATFRRADRFIVLGHAWQQFFVETVGLDPDRVRIIYNAVRGPDRVEPTAMSGSRQLLFAGVLSERKGLKELLIALGNDRLRDKSWQLNIAGNGDQTAFVRQVHTLGIADKVTFHGWVEPAVIHRLLDTSDVMALPSHHEGLPMIIIEAMAHGVAVIATPVGSISDAVTHGVTGVLVPPKDVTALIDALEIMIENPTRCRAMGIEGRKRYQQYFDISAANEHIAAEFATLL